MIKRSAFSYVYCFIGKVQFVEGVRTQVAAENKPLRLNCSTLSPVRECVWMWYEEESKVAERVVKFNFTSKHNGYDCGVTIPRAGRSLQGIWQCSVQHGDSTHPNITYARPFSLTVVKTGKEKISCSSTVKIKIV